MNKQDVEYILKSANEKFPDLYTTEIEPTYTEEDESTSSYMFRGFLMMDCEGMSKEDIAEIYRKRLAQWEFVVWP